MIEIWKKCVSFQTTSQKFTDQVRTIIKKGLFSDLKILEIHQKTRKQYNTIPDTSSGTSQEQSNRNKLPTSENKSATIPNNAQPSNNKQKLSQEQKINLQNVKRIINREKTNLPS